MMKVRKKGLYWQRQEAQRMDNKKKEEKENTAKRDPGPDREP